MQHLLCRSQHVWRRSRRRCRRLRVCTHRRHRLVVSRCLRDRARYAHVRRDVRRARRCPYLGRLLVRADDRTGAPLVAVLSHAYWQRQFGGDAAIIGQSIRLNQQPATIVGVTPPAFRGLTLGDEADVTVPLASADLFRGRGTIGNRNNWWLRVMIRRKPDVTMARVKQTLEPVFHRTVDEMLASAPPQFARGIREFAGQLRFDVRSAATGSASAFRQSLDRPLRILMGTVVIFLLIACANLAGLIASRTMSRSRGLSLRLALGATRSRLVRQTLAESVLLAAIGGALGLVVAQWVGPAFVQLLAGDAGLLAVDLRPDGWVLTFVGSVSVLTGVVAGMGALVRAARTDPQEALKKTKGQVRNSLWGRVLLAGQFALSVMLLMGAALFLQTLANYRGLNPGFAVEGRIVASVAPRLAGYDEDKLLPYLNGIVERLEAVPGVQSVTFSGSTLGSLDATTLVELPGFEAAPAEARETGRNSVGPRFIETAGLRLLHGRGIGANDTPTSERVALVNQTFARHFFGTSNAVGQRFRLIGQRTAHTIVGVIRDARDRGVTEPSQRMVYEAFSQSPDMRPAITVRSTPDLANPVPAVEHVIQQSDPAVPVRGVRLLAADMDARLRRERVLSLLTTSFAALALLLVAIGLYGTLSGIVVRRTSEIGIRMALGSTGSRVIWLVTRGTLGFVICGLAAGIAGAFALTRLIQSQLYEVSASDPKIVAVALTVLMTVALCAAVPPARRASRVDPIAALREE
ncbi:MAG: FtsX-like permease family protein [Luteitalea sp.]|nr:FtsX-like permease family protein [Luteitalea sp.]